MFDASTMFGKLTDVRAIGSALLPLKAPLASVLIAAILLMEVILEQHENALEPMLVSSGGSSEMESDVQLENALCSTEVNEDGNDVRASEVQYSNADIPIDVSASGNVSSASELHLKKEWSKTRVNDVGNVTEISDVQYSNALRLMNL